MKSIGLNELRQMFQDFYVSKEHYAQKSFPLVPDSKDKSLLLINSGMAPLKAFFAGTEKPPAPRMTTCQKCIRTGDIENVGYTARHATFFEMLGSFSFGDYFKVESIQWGWQFLTEILEIPADKLWPSVYEDDDEAFGIWQNIIGIPPEKITRLGKDDNFWEIGTGPCGPCSEIYVDRGAERGCGSPDCKPGCECDRFVEIWNHVFTQFNSDGEDNYTPLAKKNIDTGMGLERLACIMQDVDSIFDIDTIRFILDEVVRVSGVKYNGGTTPTDSSIRIITDHIRSVCFMICDGVIPSNEGRGYVLRRLLRRAARHGRLLGIKGLFMADMSNKVIEISKVAYPELEEKADYIRKLLTIEEEKFNETIEQGMAILDEYIKELETTKSTVLSGENAFKLYDTYGFPVELTEEILAEKKYTIHMENFKINMQTQKETARAGRKASDEAGWASAQYDFSVFGNTEFLGYDTLNTTSRILGLFNQSDEVQSLQQGDKGTIVLDKTPFYPEMGGQVSDNGIMSTNTANLEVVDIEKLQGAYIHRVLVRSGEIKKGDTVDCAVTPSDRNNTCRNHTATHLLHQALKDVLGSHVHQAGSLVSEESLRFDFTHFEGISPEDLLKIETIVNNKINEFIPVVSEELSIDEAKKRGATALFGEKYGDTVRVVTVPNFSMELCGGTHVSNIGQIGAFKILSENGVAAGVRRIEAITGKAMYDHLNTANALLQDAADKLKTNRASLADKLHSILEDHKVTKKELEDFRKQAMGDMVGTLMDSAKEINGVKVLALKFEDFDINELRDMSDTLKSNNASLVMVFASVANEKVTFMVSVSDDLVGKGFHAGNMIKQIAATCGGGGGGKADMAQAGAKDATKVDEALALAEKLVAEVK